MSKLDTGQELAKLTGLKLVKPQKEAQEEEASQVGPLKPYERQAGNWLMAYMEYTKESESPDNYHTWAALSCLASAARRNVWVDQGLYVLFPNLYVALVGPAGRTAKSTSIYLSGRVLRQANNIKFGPDSCTREDLIRQLAESKLNNHCCLTIHSSEFSSILDPSGIMMIQFLTDIYDCNYVDKKKGWQYSTKHQGKDIIVNPCLNILVGTTASYLAESIPSNVTGHGFTSRIIFVHEEVERQINPRPDPLDDDLTQRLINDLNHIASIHGQFQWADETAQKAYDDYYHSLYRDPPTDERIQGFHWRKKTHVLKVAMLLSLAESDSLLITEREIKTAVQLLHSLEQTLSRTFSAVGKYIHALDTERIGTMVVQSGGMPKADLWGSQYHIGANDDLEKIIKTLTTMKVISVRLKDGQEWLLPGEKKLPWLINRRG
jgi:hypothetical protein